MEAEGFKRGLDHLLSSGLDIGVITTDRAPSIWKIMRENYGQIGHEYDPWHVNKSKNHIYNMKSTYLHQIHLVLCLWLSKWWKGFPSSIDLLGVMKKLAAVASKKQNEDLRPWLKSISNHLYWSCSLSHGDGEVIMKLYSNLKCVTLVKLQYFLSNYLFLNR